FVLLDEASLSAWGWRIPFVIGAGLAVIVFWLRRGIEETPDFVAEGGKARTGGRLGELWREHRRALLIAFGLAVGSNVAFYTYTTYMQKYLVGTSGFTKPTASLICTAGLIVMLVAQPLMAALSDRIGRKPLLLWFGFAGVIGTVPLMTAIGATRDPWAAFALVTAALLIVSGATSTNAITKAELFPAHVRALGVGLPYALSQSIFGGSAEALAVSLKSAGHESLFFWYVSAMIGVSLATYLVMPETRWRSAMRREPALEGAR
ncbi:MAG: MFS transporter, partial [Sphingomonas sp.]